MADTTENILNAEEFTKKTAEAAKVVLEDARKSQIQKFNGVVDVDVVKDLRMLRLGLTVDEHLQLNLLHLTAWTGDMEIMRNLHGISNVS
ncbi:hypothetical protein R1flu_008775 [Riccia fluitans]|uniref:Uncharacterized protein n=1 Tax=Riccia fluitans TaxID=41844 RepID=A0ABD1XDW8_9MARC